MSIVKTPFPKEAFYAFFTEVANLQLPHNHDIQNPQEEVLKDFIKTRAKFPELHEYQPTELMHAYGYEDLVKGKMKTNYLLDKELMEHPEYLQCYIINSPLEGIESSSIGVILGYYDKPVENAELPENIRYYFLTTEAKLIEIKEQQVFIPILTHQDIYNDLVKAHKTLELDNLDAEHPQPIGVLKHLGKGILREDYYHVPSAFYVNEDGELDHRSFKEGTYYTSANKKLGLYRPIEASEPKTYLPAELEALRFYPGDRYRTDKKTNKTYEIASVRIKAIANNYVQILKTNIGMVLASSARIGMTIKEKDRGIWWQYLYGNPNFVNRDAHIRFCLQYQNYQVLERETPYSHEEALALLISGEVSHIQPNEYMNEWTCVRFGDQRGLHSEILAQIKVQSQIHLLPY